MHSSIDMYSEMKLKLIKLRRYMFVRIVSAFNAINARDSEGKVGFQMFPGPDAPWGTSVPPV